MVQHGRFVVMSHLESATGDVCGGVGISSVVVESTQERPRRETCEPHKCSSCGQLCYGG